MRRAVASRRRSAAASCGIAPALRGGATSMLPDALLV